MYTALVLTPQSQQQLLAHFQGLIPPTWEKIAHHLTINMGDISQGPLAQSEYKLGDQLALTVITYAYDEKVMAAGVETAAPTANKIKHITLAVNRSGGGKPFLSNQLTNWQQTSPIQLQGTIQQEN